MNEHKKDLLINVYKVDKDRVTKMNNEQIDKLLLKKQKQEIQNNKNPNKFWIINGLPSPKTIKTKTSSKAGVYVFLALVFTLLLTFVIFMLLAFDVF